jgi:hypothetical protein
MPRVPDTTVFAETEKAFPEKSQAGLHNLRIIKFSAVFGNLFKSNLNSQGRAVWTV